MEPTKSSHEGFELYSTEIIGVTSISNLDPQPVVPKKSGEEFDDIWPLDKGDVKTKTGVANRLIMEQLDRITNKEVPDPKTLPVPVPIKEMYAEFHSRLLELCPNPEFFFEKHHPISIGEDGAHVAWDIHTEKLSPAWVSLTVDVLADHKNAINVAWQRISSMDTNPASVLEEPTTPEEKAGFIHLIGKGKNNFNIFVYGNLDVQLNGIDTGEDTERLARYLDAFITRYQAQNIAHVNIDGIIVTWPNECQYNRAFDVKIKAPGVSHVDIAFAEPVSCCFCLLIEIIV